MNKMKLLRIIVFIFLFGFIYGEDFDENDFAEFDDEFDEEEFEKEDVVLSPSPPPLQQHVEEDDDDDDDVTVEDEGDSEFDVFDEDEFEGINGDAPPKKGRDEPQIKIAEVPVLLHTSWESFYLEILLILGLAVYFLNYISGKSKNNRLAQAWLNSHRHLLEENFALVGDDGKKEIENPGLVKDSENVYTLWCSGRVCCEGMLVELRFIKRQDLVGVLWHMMKPSSGTDQLKFKILMNKEDMDSFVFCLAARKTAAKMNKDMTDLYLYCSERWNAEKWGLSSSFSVMSEIPEVNSILLDQKVCAVINKFSDLIDYMHFSDQYSGPKLPDDATQNQPPRNPTDVKKVLMFAFNLPSKPTSAMMEELKPLLKLVFYLLEKIRKLRLSREAKMKAEKNRSKVEEAYLKSTHAARAEQAAAKREEKRRKEKERIMNENDPEKQRKWEEKEMKRQMKRRAPKIKQLKVKGL